MHVPDGFIDAPVSVGAGVLAAAGVAVCLRGARRELDDRTAPLAGLVAAFVFAVQMLNFPVAAGTCGHLLGGALAAILVGPYTGALCVAVVLLVQSLLFADGGLTALGVNVIDMSLVTVVVGWFVFRALIKAAAVQQARRHGLGLRRRAGVGAGVGAGVRRVLRDRRHHRRVAGRGHHGDGRRPRADRDRRGGDHRAHGGQRRRGPARPGGRRPRPAADPRPAPAAVAEHRATPARRRRYGRPRSRTS